MQRTVAASLWTLDSQACGRWPLHAEAVTLFYFAASDFRLRIISAKLRNELLLAH